MITLSSDFGSPYPAAMRGVMLQQTDARIVDISHTFPRQDIRTAAFWLREIVPWFPSAVHCAVIDPGVGTDRQAVVADCGGHQFVAPDNGLVRPVVRALTETDDDVDWYAIRIDDPASSTFHGRDIFAPAAAAVHERPMDALLEEDLVVPTTPETDLTFPEPTEVGGAIHGEVLVVDDFGNAITNIPGETFVQEGSLRVNGDTVPFVPSFAHVDAGTPLLTVGSHGNIELAVNQGRGDTAFDVTPGEEIVVERA